MNKYIKIMLVVILFNSLKINLIQTKELNKSDIDLTLIGVINYADGIGRVFLDIMEIFKNKLSINFINDNNERSIILDSNKSNVQFLDIINNNKDKVGKVSLFFNTLEMPHVTKVPNSFIKIAYSTFESTQLPKEWVINLNNFFDLVVVPDKFLVKVYKNSGVTIPIFELPHLMYIDNHLNFPVKFKKNKPFVFGCSAHIISKKNQELLLKAFLNRFNNNLNVKLQLHTTLINNETYNKIKNILKEYDCQNVEIIEKTFSSQEHLDFLASLDCYALLSKGEGFSFTPRESIALGIPTIISNNTAHETLCKTGYFIPVNSKIKIPADYTWYDGQYHGYNFDCKLEDVEWALDKVYNNYTYYLKKAHKGREWVKKYTYKNLGNKYMNLIKPKKVILGNKNIITDDYLMTNSKELYIKYLKIK